MSGVCCRAGARRKRACLPALLQPVWTGGRLRRFSEQDVALILALLKAAGFQLRHDDPAAMKVRRGLRHTQSEAGQLLGSADDLATHCDRFSEERGHA